MSKIYTKVQPFPMWPIFLSICTLSSGNLMGTAGVCQGNGRYQVGLFFGCSSAVLRLFFGCPPPLPASRRTKNQHCHHTIKTLQENLGRKRFCKDTKSRGHLQAMGEKKKKRKNILPIGKKLVLLQPQTDRTVCRKKAHFRLIPNRELRHFTFKSNAGINEKSDAPIGICIIDGIHPPWSGS